MFTLSCYAFHPFILKFVRIWRYVQVVSDVLTCIVSMLCCQCVDMMPLSLSSSSSKPSIQIFKSKLPNSAIGDSVQGKGPGENQRPPQVVIDFPPQRGDTAQEKIRSKERLVQKDQEPQEPMKQPEKKQSTVIKKLSATSSTRTQNSREKVIPSIHNSMRKISKRDVQVSPSIAH